MAVAFKSDLLEKCKSHLNTAQPLVDDEVKSAIYRDYKNVNKLDLEDYSITELFALAYCSPSIAFYLFRNNRFRKEFNKFRNGEKNIWGSNGSFSFAYYYESIKNEYQHSLFILDAFSTLIDDPNLIQSDTQKLLNEDVLNISNNAKAKSRARSNLHFLLSRKTDEVINSSYDATGHMPNNVVASLRTLVMYDKLLNNVLEDVVEYNLTKKAIITRTMDFVVRVADVSIVNTMLNPGFFTRIGKVLKKIITVFISDAVTPHEYVSVQSLISRIKMDFDPAKLIIDEKDDKLLLIKSLLENRVFGKDYWKEIEDINDWAFIFYVLRNYENLGNKDAKNLFKLARKRFGETSYVGDNITEQIAELILNTDQAYQESRHFSARNVLRQTQSDKAHEHNVVDSTDHLEERQAADVNQLNASRATSYAEPHDLARVFSPRAPVYPKKLSFEDDSTGFDAVLNSSVNPGEEVRIGPDGLDVLSLDAHSAVDADEHLHSEDYTDEELRDDSVTHHPAAIASSQHESAQQETDNSSDSENDDADLDGEIAQARLADVNVDEKESKDNKEEKEPIERASNNSDDLPLRVPAAQSPLSLLKQAAKKGTIESPFIKPATPDKTPQSQANLNEVKGFMRKNRHHPHFPAKPSMLVDVETMYDAESLPTGLGDLQPAVNIPDDDVNNLPIGLEDAANNPGAPSEFENHEPELAAGNVLDLPTGMGDINKDTVLDLPTGVADQTPFAAILPYVAAQVADADQDDSMNVLDLPIGTADAGEQVLDLPCGLADAASGQTVQDNLVVAPSELEVNVLNLPSGSAPPLDDEDDILNLPMGLNDAQGASDTTDIYYTQRQFLLAPLPPQRISQLRQDGPHTPSFRKTPS